MINVSDKMKEYVLKTGRSFKGKIEVDGQTEYEGIMNIFIDRSMCSDCLNFGEVNSAYCSISVYEPSVSFASKEITAYISAVIDGEDEWVKLGEFTAEKPTVSDKIVEFTAFDCIKYKTDITYFPTLENESAISLVFEDICNQCGVSFLSIDNELTINPAKLSGMKCKDALGQIAGFLGGNIVTDNEGRVTVRYVSECDYTIDEDMMTEPTIGEAVFTLDGILCTVGDDALTCGSTEGNVITFSNVLMTQEQLNSIFAKYQSLTYHSVSVENLVGNPFLEVGDTISMERYGVVYKIPIMHLTIDFDGGVLNDIETYHKTIEEESGGKSVSDVLKDIENIKAENNLSADFANAISNAMGLHYSKQRLEDGSYKIYGHDKDSLAESTYIFTNTAEGFAFVTGEDCWNDGSPEWQYGFSKDGNAILKMLNVHKLTADLITAGKLQSKDGNTYFDLENDEISTLTTDDEGNATTRTLLKDGTFTCADASNFQTTIDSAGLTSINVPIDMTSFPEKPDNWDKLGIIGKIPYFMRVLAQYRRGICLVSPCTAEAENVYLNHSNPRANQMVKLDNDFNALQTTEYTAEGVSLIFFYHIIQKYKSGVIK